MDGKKLFEKMESLAGTHGVTIHYKTDSSLMKVIAVAIWIFNREFMTQYTTTIGTKVYFPSRKMVTENPERAARTIAHELVHAVDSTKLSSLVFSTVYLFPQILALGALGALGAFLSSSWLWCLLFLIFLLPLPAPGRMWAEVRGYTVSMAMRYWLEYDAEPNYEPYLDQFGRPYYWMWPFRSHLTQKFDRMKQLIVDGQLDSEIPVAAEIFKAVTAASTV